VLVVGLVLPSAGEAAVRSVRRAPVGQARRSAVVSIFAAGNGTQQNPYIIRSENQLSAFAASVNNGNTYDGQYIKLGANIDLGGVEWTSIGLYDNNGDTRPFKGFFDGAGFAIFNMGHGNNSKPATAFFGALLGARINGVSLQFLQMTGGSNVGGLVGFMTGSELTNCLVSGVVKGQTSVGGIVGSAVGGFILNCKFSGEVVGASEVGGIAGVADYVTMRTCSVTGQIEGNTNVGGFVGKSQDGMIIDGTAGVVLIQGGRNVGGFAGNLIDGGRVEGAAFNGQVRGDSCVGGIVGHTTFGTIVRSSVSGSITGRTQLGGIVGDLVNGEVRRCNATASVDGISDIGGIAGRMSGGSLVNNANYGVVSGGEAVGGIVGNFSGESLNLSLSANRSIGSVNGYFNTGPLVGAHVQ